MNQTAFSGVNPNPAMCGQERGDVLGVFGTKREASWELLALWLWTFALVLW